LVIFGISGDLAKKMTFKALYALHMNGTLDVPVIGVARDDWTHDDLIQHARDSIEGSSEEKGGEEIDDDAFAAFCKRVTYVQGDYKEADTYQRLKKEVGSAKHPVFYLEIPPSLFADVVDQLGSADMTEGARVVIEKPFGHDLASAKELNERITQV